MKPRIKFGLIVGAVGLVLNTCLSAAMGICGPLAALAAGALAGLLTARAEQSPSKNAGAQAGAISGLVAGALVLVGQVIGAVLALVIIQRTGVRLPFGAAPGTLSGAGQIAYYLTGLGTGACFGVVGVVLSALSGAGVAYLSTPENQVSPPVM